MSSAHAVGKSCGWSVRVACPILAPQPLLNGFHGKSPRSRHRAVVSLWNSGTPV
ncbi:hypothetical protein BN174_4310006 [Clostridioides difficile E15]|nr:hypothetical protein BN174_4310006 [Clostridioides difficile E15]